MELIDSTTIFKVRNLFELFCGLTLIEAALRRSPAIEIELRTTQSCSAKWMDFDWWGECSVAKMVLSITSPNTASADPPSNVMASAPQDDDHDVQMDDQSTGELASTKCVPETMNIRIPLARFA